MTKYIHHTGFAEHTTRISDNYPDLIICFCASDEGFFENGGWANQMLIDKTKVIECVFHGSEGQVHFNKQVGNKRIGGLFRHGQEQGGDDFITVQGVVWDKCCNEYGIEKALSIQCFRLMTNTHEEGVWLSGCFSKQ